LEKSRKAILGSKDGGMMGDPYQGTEIKTEFWKLAITAEAAGNGAVQISTDFRTVILS
jgi:hypothetical protein